MSVGDGPERDGILTALRLAWALLRDGPKAADAAARHLEDAGETDLACLARESHAAADRLHVALCMTSGPMAAAMACDFAEHAAAGDALGAPWQRERTRLDRERIAAIRCAVQAGAPCAEAALAAEWPYWNWTHRDAVGLAAKAAADPLLAGFFCARAAATARASRSIGIRPRRERSRARADELAWQVERAQDALAAELGLDAIGPAVGPPCGDTPPVDWPAVERRLDAMAGPAPEAMEDARRAAIAADLGDELLHAAVECFLTQAAGWRIAEAVLERLRPQAAVQRCLQTVVGSADDRRRLLAALLLARMADGRVLPWIGRLLGDALPEVQFCGAECLCALKAQGDVDRARLEGLQRACRRHPNPEVRERVAQA